MAMLFFPVVNVDGLAKKRKRLQVCMTGKRGEAKTPKAKSCQAITVVSADFLTLCLSAI